MLKSRLSVPNIPILSLVSTYNAYLRFFLHGFALHLPWNQKFIEEIGKCVVGLHNNLFGNDGIVSEIRRLMVERFTKSDQDQEKEKNKDEGKLDKGTDKKRQKNTVEGQGG